MIVKYKEIVDIHDYSDIRQYFKEEELNKLKKALVKEWKEDIPLEEVDISDGDWNVYETLEFLLDLREEKYLIVDNSNESIESLSPFYSVLKIIEE